MTPHRADEARGLAYILADLGHQLRTPLNGVVGMAGVLGETRLDPGQQQMAQVIESSGRALNAMLSDLLELARLESGGFEPADRPFSLAEAGEGARLRAAPDILCHGAALTLDVSPLARDCEVRGDETAVRAVISRLLRRAARAAEGGQIAAGLALGADGGAVIRIARTAGAPAAAEIGGDLDLPLCRAMVQAMGGALEVLRDPGGAETGYRVLLPLRLCAAAA